MHILEREKTYSLYMYVVEVGKEKERLVLSAAYHTWPQLHLTDLFYLQTLYWSNLFNRNYNDIAYLYLLQNLLGLYNCEILFEIFGLFYRDQIKSRFFFFCEEIFLKYSFIFLVSLWKIYNHFSRIIPKKLT